MVLIIFLLIGPTNTSTTEAQRTPVTTSVTTYSLPSGTTYYYDTTSGYTVAGGNIVARPFTPSTGSFATVPQNTPVQIRSAPLPTQVHGKNNSLVKAKNKYFFL